MNKIRVLPEIIANKIAAGEIVERPASVVKELVENSIDALCRSVYVSVASGGKRSITVRDDGEGMTQDDAILAFEHHATSKLHRVEDLAAIATLGFRGEALPSIASVSRMTLRTRPADAQIISGTEVEVQGGVLRSVKPISWDQGTEVVVRDLFFNVPARRKFLRSHETELGHISRLVTHYALAHPEIRFSLQSETRLLIDAVAVTNLKDRVYQIFGERFLDNLVEFAGDYGDIKVRGFTSRPSEQRTNPYWQFFYVNRRMVRDKVISSAVRKAYRNCLPASAYPVVILFVELPFDQVDVNAHPAKTEIRFRDQSTVHDLIFKAIDEALARSTVIPPYRYQAIGQQIAGQASDFGAQRSANLPSDDGMAYGTVAEPVSSHPFQPALEYLSRPVASPPERTYDQGALKAVPEMLLNSAMKPETTFSPPAVRILGQLQESYIIACDSQGLLIIDQHAAHERILYEKLAQQIKKNSVETQGLLVPILLDLSPHQVAWLEKVMPELAQNGFQVEHFGGTSILIRTVPAIASGVDCRKLVSEILDGLEASERTVDIQEVRDRIAVAVACKAAVKANMSLTVEKMQWLLDQLALTRMPTNCPHGRPTMLRFSLGQIERNFGRI